MRNKLEYFVSGSNLPKRRMIMNSMSLWQFDFKLRKCNSCNYCIALTQAILIPGFTSCFYCFILLLLGFSSNPPFTRSFVMQSSSFYRRCFCSCLLLRDASVCWLLQPQHSYFFIAEVTNNADTIYVYTLLYFFNSSLWPIANLRRIGELHSSTPCRVSWTYSWILNVNWSHIFWINHS